MRREDLIIDRCRVRCLQPRSCDQTKNGSDPKQLMGTLCQDQK